MFVAAFGGIGGATAMAYDQFIGCDAHKRYSVFVGVDEKGRVGAPVRVEHKREAYRTYLQSLPPGRQIAVEASTGWYWSIEEMEQRAHKPVVVRKNNMPYPLTESSSALT